MQRIIALLTLALALAFGSGTASADSKTDKKLEDCRKVFESFTDLSEQSVPTWMLERAFGIVVIPQVIKGAVIFGGRGGRGCMAVRNPDGNWSNPVFVQLGGGSWGFQFGVQSSDVVLVLMSRQSVEGISGGKVTLGADASVAAGPLGRSASANTDATFKAQVLSYSRSEGLFFGVALDGSVISVDEKYNWIAYDQVEILRPISWKAGPGPCRRRRRNSPLHSTVRHRPRQRLPSRRRLRRRQSPQPLRRRRTPARTQMLRRPTRWRIRSRARPRRPEARRAGATNAGGQRRRLAQRLCETGPDRGVAQHHAQPVDDELHADADHQEAHQPGQRDHAGGAEDSMESLGAAQHEPGDQDYGEDAGRHAEEIGDAVPALPRTRLRAQAHHDGERAWARRARASQAA